MKEKNGRMTVNDLNPDLKFFRKKKDEIGIGSYFLTVILSRSVSATLMEFVYIVT